MTDWKQHDIDEAHRDRIKELEYRIFFSVCVIIEVVFLGGLWNALKPFLWEG